MDGPIWDVVGIGNDGMKDGRRRWLQEGIERNTYWRGIKEKVEGVMWESR